MDTIIEVTETDEATPAGEAASEDTLPPAIKEILRKERTARREAEKRAIAAERAGMSDAERLAFLETRNSELELRELESAAVSSALAEVEPGYAVDRARLAEELRDMRLTAENVDAVVARAVKRNLRPDNLLPGDETKQIRTDNAPKKQSYKDAPSLSQVLPKSAGNGYY